MDEQLRKIDEKHLSLQARRGIEMTPVDALIEQFEELIPKTTAFEWERKGRDVCAGGRGIVASIPTPARGGVFECDTNTSYIALANPSNLRVLLDELKRLRQLELHTISLGSMRQYTAFEPTGGEDRACVNCLAIFQSPIYETCYECWKAAREANASVPHDLTCSNTNLVRDASEIPE